MTLLTDVQTRKKKLVGLDWIYRYVYQQNAMSNGVLYKIKPRSVGCGIFWKKHPKSACLRLWKAG